MLGIVLTYSHLMDLSQSSKQATSWVKLRRKALSSKTGFRILPEQHYPLLSLLETLITSENFLELSS